MYSYMKILVVCAYFLRILRDSCLLTKKVYILVFIDNYMVCGIKHHISKKINTKLSSKVSRKRVKNKIRWF